MTFPAGEVIFLKRREVLTGEDLRQYLRIISLHNARVVEAFVKRPKRALFGDAPRFGLAPNLRKRRFEDDTA